MICCLSLTGVSARLSISKLVVSGGLTKARRLRDVALNAGIKFIIMDTGGGVIADTATQHFAWTIPPAFRIATWLCQDMLAVDVVDSERAPETKTAVLKYRKTARAWASTQRKNAGKTGRRLFIGK